VVPRFRKVEKMVPLVDTLLAQHQAGRRASKSGPTGHQCFEEMRREINRARKNCRWRGSRTPQGEEPMARFPLQSVSVAVGMPSAVSWTRIGATQPHYMRVRLRSNCIGPKQRTVGKISVRGCLRCRSATDSCEFWEFCIRYPHRDGRSLGGRGFDRCRQRSGRDRPYACCDYRDDSFIAEHNVERPFTKRLRNRCESQIAGHHG
jgi:hypothetical protein